MPRKKALLSPEQMGHLQAGGVPVREIASRAGISHVSVLRTLEKIKDTVRKAEEFKGESTAARTAPRRDLITTSWDLKTIRAARDDQLQGRFRRPVDMAKHMRTDDALYVAYHTRLAPQASVLRSLVPSATTRGRAVMKKAATSIQTPGSVLMSLHGTFADHGVAIGYNEQEVADDGTRVDFRLTEWPLEHVFYNASLERLQTYTRAGEIIDITHGDGRWTVFKKFATMPWTQEAAVLAGAFVWASHATVLSDANSSATAHGMSKLIGELPPGVPIGTKDALGSEAAAFLRMLQDLVSGNAAAGIRPSGSKTDFASDNSTMWQLFQWLAENREKAAARIYLGTDAILGSIGGAPGIDISQLFALASSKLQGDFECIEQALRSGVYEPWTAINEGDSRYAPWLVYKLPDTDALRRAEEQSKKRAYFFDAIKAYQDGGMLVDQATVDMLARDYGVVPAPKLAAVPHVQIEFAPTQRDNYVFANEARVSDGLPAHPSFEGKTLGALTAAAQIALKSTPTEAIKTDPVPAPALPPITPAAPPPAAA